MAPAAPQAESAAIVTPRFTAFSVATKIRGSFVITPSTPAATTRASSARSSTVQASTGRPAAWARSTDDSVTSRCCSITALAPTRRASRGRRSGTEARIDVSPSETIGHRYGLREIESLSSGYVIPTLIRGAARATARRLATWTPLTTVRASSPWRSIGADQLVEPRPQLEVDVQPDLRGLVDEEGQRLVERREAPGQRRAAPRARGRAHVPLAAPWLTSSRWSEWASTSGPRARSSTSNSIRSTPASTAARNERSVFSGASAAAPR